MYSSEGLRPVSNIPSISAFGRVTFVFIFIGWLSSCEKYRPSLESGKINYVWNLS